MTLLTNEHRFDLDLLRGWTEARDPSLSAEHALPALAHLTARHPDGSVRAKIGLHGTEVYLGRFHPQQGPVDILLSQFEDHEIYKFSAPHCRFIRERNQWYVKPSSPICITELNGTPLLDTRQQYPIEDGDQVVLGCIEFKFNISETPFDDWLEAKKQAFRAVRETALFLIRAGAVAGPHFILGDMESAVIGRNFPNLRPGWDQTPQPDWNLAGVTEHERKFIAFRHIELRRDGPEWVLEPLTKRQRTYVNRIEVTGPTDLMPGDEIGLGSLLLHFHDPSQFEASTQRRTAELPAVVNWHEEHTSPKLQPLEPALQDAISPAHDETEASDATDEPESPEDV